MGGASAPGGLDSGLCPPHHQDVRRGRDAHSLPEAAASQQVAAKLLRDQYLRVVEGTDPARLQFPRPEDAIERPPARDRLDCRPTDHCANGSAAVATSVRSTSGPCGRRTHGRSKRPKNACSHLQGEWSGQTNGGKTISAGGWNDFRKVEATTST